MMNRRIRTFTLLFLWLLATQNAWAAPQVGNRVGRALGGKISARYRALDGRLPRFDRVLDNSSENPGSGPALKLPSAAHGEVGYLDRNHYESIRDASLTLLRTYAPEHSYYIAAGRAPVGIATFLSVLNPHMVMTFPASDMRLQIQPAWLAAYHEHFAALIPDDVIQGTRTLVLFDRSRAQSGTSLARLKSFLEQYLGAVGSVARVEAVGFAPAGALVEGVTHMDTADFPHLFLYQQGQYDHDEQVAPYLGKHRIGEHALAALRDNPNFHLFRDALEARMQHDGKLDKVLVREFSHLLEAKQ